MQLHLVLSTDEELESALSGPAKTTPELPKLPVQQPPEVPNDRKSGRRSKKPKVDPEAMKPKPKDPDDLFYKTKAKPSIYWLPKME